MSYIPEDIIENIRNQVDIVELISEYTPLKRKGNNYAGSCPFHQENDPSFTVSPEKQIFYCFGCASGGNIFKFLMLYEGFTFREAVETLAQKVGIEIPVSGKKDKQESSKRNFAHKINSQVKEFFKNVLHEWEEAASAREYLLQRGLNQEVMQFYELGYSPSSWNQLVKRFTKDGYDVETLASLGLAANGKRGAYDRFRSRIMFPIRDTSGNVVGFGGRVIDEGQPKYLNTPETEYFNKSKLLYGLYEARRYIKDAGYAVIMEGYMDVISAWRHGVTNAVASLGTSLTSEQVRILMRYTRDVIIAYDSDSAGVAATMRGLDLIQESGCRVRVVSIPGEKDPDEFLQRHGIQGWQSLISKAESIVEYKLRQIKSSDKMGVGSKTAQLEQILPNLYNIQDEIERSEAIKLVATRLYTTWDAVAGELNKYESILRKSKAQRDKITKNRNNIIHNVHKIDARSKAEKVLLKLMLENPHWIPSVQSQFEENFFKNTVYNNIFQKTVSLLQWHDYSPANLLDKLDEDEQRALSNLLMEDLPGDNPSELLNTYIKAVQKYINKERRESLMSILLEAEKNGDKKRVNQILNQLQALY